MTALTRREKLSAINRMHTEWVRANLAEGSKAFDPSGRKTGSDYNQHHVEIDAGGQAQDRFEQDARSILDRPTRADEGRKHLPGLHDQRTHGRHSAANRAREAATELAELRESLARAQERMGGRPLREDHAAADRRLLGERLRRNGGDQLGPSDVLERTERQASGRNDEALQARARLQTAKFALARDRAQVLARLEEIASINEGLDDTAVVGRQLRVALGRDNLTDDPRLAPLLEAVETGDTHAVLDAINGIAETTGLRRIGGDQRLGPDQIIPFDPKQHEALGQRPRNGQQALLVRPGYATTVDGQESVIAKAVVTIADEDDITRAEQAARRRKHLRGLHDQSSHGRRRGATSAVSSAAKWISPDEAMAMREKMLADQPWTDDQRDALNRYVGSSYGWMNGMLRGDPDADNLRGEEEEPVGDEKAKELIRDAAAGMRPTVEPVRAKRFVAGFESFGLDMSQLTRDEAAEALKAMKGKTLQEPGFMSTSLGENYGNDTWIGRFKLELDVPQGAQGAYLDGDVGFEGEQELLLAPGTRFQILEVVIDPPRNTVKGRVVVE